MPLETTCAIFLAFHPSDDDLRYVRGLAGQMNVVVISNSGVHDFGFDTRAMHCFEENVGVGEGYNRGLELARSIGSTHVVFHDQDSRLRVGQVELALQRLVTLDPKANSVALSLLPVDNVTGRAREARVTKPRVVGNLLQYREVQFSGLVAPICLFEDRPFSPYLFVDFVDFEWCWKVAPQVRFLRDKSLTIGHSIGSGTMRTGGLEYSLPSPFRHYYQVRNVAVLASMPHVPRQWVVRISGKYLLRAIALPLIDRPRCWESWKASVRGLSAARRFRKSGSRRREALFGSPPQTPAR
jgi:rhamnosyltransferase